MSEKPSVRFHALDSLRGVGAFFVLFIHCLQTLHVYDIFPNAQLGAQLQLSEVFLYTPFRVLVNGRSLVMFFFVLSGFVLAYGLHNSRQKANFWLYLKRRFARIYLPFAGTGVMAFIFMQLPGWPLQGDIIGYFLLSGTNAGLAPNALAWSLVYELRVSLFVPLLCWLAWRYEREMIVAMIFLAIFQWIGIFGLRIGQFPYGSDSYMGTFVITVRYLIAIYIGIWLARCIIEKRAWLDKVQGKWIPILGIVTYCLMNISLDEPGMLGSIGIIVLVFRSKAFSNFLEMPVSLWLARISYSLYLTHFLILHLGWCYLPIENNVLRIFCAALCAFAYGELYQRLVEAPSIKLAKSIK
jgi:peptidoglycan/LPS O-acetylase OafA/YrhL